ncbi:hypothetical protein HHL16_07760 [Pseudoflavitalea sp. G-6-1-2]|uniref:hypothetical protein n=1 Tax=Pseudoflavitalea sp. G-6-1-2 TaxID=2728841 RepID=UPI00146AD4B0|nr:hypothetical protein [Pseudoflavitalea sp. G-6-1-2]NML20765.1 hypothetical protein [Pseudoflavitalea sp. G-6-1-2]
MPSWSKKIRVVLVDDAAWCASLVTGAGATLALVGAYRLAGDLAAANGAHIAAFSTLKTATGRLLNTISCRYSLACWCHKPDWASGHAIV